MSHILIWVNFIWGTVAILISWFATTAGYDKGWEDAKEDSNYNRKRNAR